MNYFKFPIHLDVDKIKLLSDPAVQELTHSIERFSLPLFNFKQVIPEVVESLETLFNSPILKSRIFLYPSNFNMNTCHIDGQPELPVKWALNIPLFGTENSTMNWFDINKDTDGLDNVTPPDGKNSASLQYKIEKLPFDRLELLTPHIVKTDTPHSVTNLKNTPRAIMSLRFESSVVDSIDIIHNRLSGIRS